MKRIPTLDGWRGVAIVLVLIEHYQVYFSRSTLIQTGMHGVVVFFVLSGYLITGKLLEPNVSLGCFYVRRMFRLMPVVWTFLLFLAIPGLLATSAKPSSAEIWSCLLFVRNYFTGRATAQFWSLSIEEQFYLVWPAVLLLCGASRARWVAILGVAASYLWWLTHQEVYIQFGVNARTEVNVGGLLTGCLLAIVLREEGAKQRFLDWSRWLFWTCLPYLAYTTLRPYPVASPLECAAWGLVIAHTALAGSKVLSWGPLVWLGRISYSLYVWNLLSFAIISAAPNREAKLVFLCIPIASYYCVERPGIALGNWVMRQPLRIPVLEQEGSSI